MKEKQHQHLLGHARITQELLNELAENKGVDLSIRRVPPSKEVFYTHKVYVEAVKARPITKREAFFATRRD